jgi:hypothetical protein
MSYPNALVCHCQLCYCALAWPHKSNICHQNGVEDLTKGAATYYSKLENYAHFATYYSTLKKHVLRENTFIYFDMSFCSYHEGKTLELLKVIGKKNRSIPQVRKSIRCKYMIF